MLLDLYEYLKNTQQYIPLLMGCKYMKITTNIFDNGLEIQSCIITDFCKYMKTT